MASCFLLVVVFAMRQILDEKNLLFADWLVVLWRFFMGSTSTVIAHGVHLLTVSLIQAGTAKIEKPLVRYTAYC